jgi:hypothetical protein
MKKRLTVTSLFALALSASAAEPLFQEGVLLKAGDKPINLYGGHLVPTVTDWNNDGLKDLIIGHFIGTKGNMVLLLNEGSDAAPVFKQMTLLEAGEKPINLESG